MEIQPGKSAGLFGYCVSDAGLRFHNWLYENRIGLGKSSGRILTWRPIGDPAQCDDVYRNQRTTELAAIEATQSKSYRDSVSQMGSEEIYLQNEYLHRSGWLGVDFEHAPFVVFGAPQLKERVAIPIPIGVFDQPKTRRDLAGIFMGQFSETALAGYSFGGFLTEKSMREFSGSVQKTTLAVYKLINGGARKLPERLTISLPEWRNSQPIDPSLDTIISYQICPDGALKVRGVSRGQPAVEHTFNLGECGATKQQNLMHVLLEFYPDPVALTKLLNELYADEVSKIAEGQLQARTLKGRLRALISDTQSSLEKSGFPPGIIPKLRQVKTGDREFSLSVADVKAPQADPWEIPKKVCFDVENIIEHSDNE